MNDEETIAWFTHEVVHYESQIDSDHKTDDKYTAVVENENGDFVPLGREISKERFVREAAKGSVEVNQSKRKQGADVNAPDRVTEVVYSVTTKVKPEREIHVSEVSE